MTERPPSRQPIPEHAKCVFTGNEFSIYQWEQELFDGTTAIFEKARRRQDAVVAIPSLADGRLVITLDEQPGRLPLVTFPGGHIEEGEDPKDAAARELLEETGYAGELEYWYGFQPETRVDYAVFIFVARNCTKVAEPRNDAGERITTRFITLDELMDIANEANFQNTTLRPILIEAKYNPEVRAKLEGILFGKR